MADTDWICNECEMENILDDAICVACETPNPNTGSDNSPSFFKIGIVKSVEQIPKMDKLKALTISVDPSDLDKTITVVTNSKNIDTVGLRVVVALCGASVNTPNGQIVVEKTVVGGRKSEGMLCNAAMLNWKGGGALAVVLSDSYNIGDAPPETRPREEK